MSRYNKPALFMLPALASLLSLTISTVALADRPGAKGPSPIGENSASQEDNSQDNRPGQRGEQVIAPQIVEEPRQPAERPRLRGEQVIAPQIVEQQGQIAERLRGRENQGDNQQDSVQAQLLRQQNRQNIAAQQQAERDAAAHRVALLRNNNDSARRNRGEPSERADERAERRDNANENRGNSASPGNPIAYNPTRPQPGQDQTQWQQQQQERQANEYRRHLDNQNPIALRFNQRLREQNRNQQYRSQQRYYERVNQQRRYDDNDKHSYFNNSYYNSPNIYRYNRGGNYHYANRYQADLMRQAINYGYEEGFHAGRADRMDRWGYNYREAYAYQDANYGYHGYYVDRGTYNYYFREGFRRGYDDGYNSRNQYGRRYNNGYSANDSIMRLILNFSNWR